LHKDAAAWASSNVPASDDERIANVDGAPSIRNQPELHGTVDHIGLDFYHLSEHIHTARRKRYGEEDADGLAWAAKILHRVRHEGYAPARQTAVDSRSTATGSGRVGVDRLLGYMSERREMIRYPEFLARGCQIGSGPIEAQCKTTPKRVKGSGMRWGGPNAEAVTALARPENYRLWESYWLTAASATNQARHEILADPGSQAGVSPVYSQAGGG